MASAVRKFMEYMSLSPSYDKNQPESYVEYEETNQPVGGYLEESPEGHSAEITPLYPQRYETVQMSRIVTIRPNTFSDASIVAEHFREGIPVVMDLSKMTKEQQQRMVDFVYGLVLGLGGTLERVSSLVFLLSPSHVEITSAKDDDFVG